MNGLNQYKVPVVSPQKIYNYSQSGRTIFRWNIKMSHFQGLKNKSLKIID